MEKKILLVTDSWDNSMLSDGYLKSQLVKFIPRDILQIYLLDTRFDGVSQKAINDAGLSLFSKPLRMKKWKAPFFMRRFQFAFGYLQALWMRFFESASLAKSIYRHATKNGIAKIWIVVQGPMLLWIAQRLERQYPEKVYVQFSYAGSTWGANGKLDRMSSLLARKSKASLLASAKNIAVESQAALQKTAGAKQAIFPALENVETTSKTVAKDKFVLGIIGPLKGHDSLEAFVWVLDSVYWQIEGKNIEIHYFGNDAVPTHRSRIIPKQNRSPQQILAEVSGCDLIYCPYSYEGRLSERTADSFPNEMLIALQTNIPLFYHGPPSGYIPQYFSDVGGVFCFSTETEVLLMNLRKAFFFSRADMKTRSSYLSKLSQDSANRLEVQVTSFLRIKKDQRPANQPVFELRG